MRVPPITLRKIRKELHHTVSLLIAELGSWPALELSSSSIELSTLPMVDFKLQPEMGIVGS
jgi:hypothetical protein